MGKSGEESLRRALELLRSVDRGALFIPLVIPVFAFRYDARLIMGGIRVNKGVVLVKNHENIVVESEVPLHVPGCAECIEIIRRLLAEPHRNDYITALYNRLGYVTYVNLEALQTPRLHQDMIAVFIPFNTNTCYTLTPALTGKSLPCSFTELCREYVRALAGTNEVTNVLDYMIMANLVEAYTVYDNHGVLFITYRERLLKTLTYVSNRLKVRLDKAFVAGLYKFPAKLYVYSA